MKKLLAAALFLISFQSYAAGPYDGIWAIFPYGYATISEHEGVLIVVSVLSDDYGGYWQAYQGPRVNNTAKISLIRGYVNAEADVIFDSDNTLKITQTSCTPISADTYCTFPNGYVLTGSKVW